MEIYSKLSKKQLRIIEKEFKYILSEKGLVLPKNREDLKKCNIPFGTKLYYENKDYYLTKKAEVSYTDINNLIISTNFKSNFLSSKDYFQSTREVLNEYFIKNSIPTIKDFLITIESYLLDKIKEYTYVSKVHGIELENLEEIGIGNKTIKYFKYNIIPSIPKEKNFLRKIIVSVKKDYKNELIIKGKEKGSESKSEKNFFKNCNLLIAVLRVYSCVIYKNSISSIALGLINDFDGYRGNPTSFKWEDGDGSTFSYRMHKKGKTHKLKIENETWKNAKSYYKLKELASLVEKENRNEVEEAIIKALYWLGEAQKDNTLASSWIKLWSCLECFFSIHKNDVTKSNIKGISVFLTIGHYDIEGLNDYKNVKNKIGKFYDKRSKIVHRSEYTHIKYNELTELSYIVSFVIINAMFLVEKGYSQLIQIKEEINRLTALVEN